MSEQAQSGQGKTGGLPGANADPRTAELAADQAAEVMPTEESDTQAPRDR
ncbi:hypothetical protein [Quadrisphaera sp. DSM 44207]|nr:hypothetical protein [Quadrisphaera sp. DSM 44207]SDQ37465.1 hypothetical protein SAMN05428996_1453 [Quadrisphaera sp. DSM 44207]